MRCDTCLHARAIISENGLHYSCCLSEDGARDCLLRKKDGYILNPMKKDKEDIKN